MKAQTKDRGVDLILDCVGGSYWEQNVDAYALAPHLTGVSGRHCRSITSRANHRLALDGRWIVYSTDRREAPWFGVPIEDNELRAVSPELAAPTEGGETTLVADISGPIGAFAEGPGGRWLAVGSVLGGTPHSYTRSLAS